MSEPDVKYEYEERLRKAEDADLQYQLERLRAYADGETDKLRDALRKLDEQDDLINRLATVARTAQEYIAAHPCDHPSGCAYRDDLNRAVSYTPTGLSGS